MNPTWLLILPFAGAVAWAIAAGLIAHFFAVYVFSKYPLVEEGEPAIDLDLLEAELLMEFCRAPSHVRPVRAK